MVNNIFTILVVFAFGCSVGYFITVRRLRKWVEKGQKKKEPSVVKRVEIAVSKANYTIDEFFNLPLKEQLRRRVQSLIDEAAGNGYVLTIELKPYQGCIPKMGQYMMIYDIRESKERYRKLPPFDKE